MEASMCRLRAKSPSSTSAISRNPRRAIGKTRTPRTCAAKAIFSPIFAQGACRHRLGDAERIVGQRVAHGHHAQRFQRADSAAVRFERGNRGLPCGAHNTPLWHDRMIVRRAEFPIIRGGAIRRNTACGRPDKAKPRRPFGLPGFRAVISRFTLQRAGPCQP